MVGYLHSEKAIFFRGDDMSGPKISEYELEAMLRLQLEAERLLLEAEKLERELQKQYRRELLGNRDEYVATLTKMNKSLPENTELINSSQKRLGDESVALLKNSITDNINKKIVELMDLEKIQDNDELEKKLMDYPSEISKIKKSLQNFGVVVAETTEKLNAALSNEIVSLFNNTETETNTIIDSDDRDLIYVKRSLEKVEELQNQRQLPAAYQELLQQAIAGIKKARINNNLVGYCTIELPELLKPCESFLKLWARDGQEYKKLSLQYEILFKQNGGSKLQMVPFDANAVEKLKSLVAIEEFKAQQAVEKAYIATAMNETMAEMGYDVIGQREVTKRSGKHFRNELYQYGEKTAINITYSDDGQIAMELGKLDKTDRVPTASESNFLANQMTGFCEKFAELEKRLAQKGIKLGKRIALSPPTADYAQIINSHDYSTKEQPQTISQRTKRQSIHRMLKKRD